MPWGHSRGHERVVGSPPGCSSPEWGGTAIPLGLRLSCSEQSLGPLAIEPEGLLQARWPIPWTLETSAPGRHNHLPSSPAKRERWGRRWPLEGRDRLAVSLTFEKAGTYLAEG